MFVARWGKFRPPYSAVWLYSNPKLGPVALHIYNGERQIDKDEIHSSQYTPQRIVSAKDSSVHQSHIAVSILCSTTPTALNQGMIFCLCLVHINMDSGYTSLPLIRWHSASLGPVWVFWAQKKNLCMTPNPKWWTHAKVSSLCKSSDCSPRERTFLCICQTS